MALSIEDREHIREEEWVRALARRDFERQNPRVPQAANSLTGILGMFLTMLGAMASLFLFIRLFDQTGGL